MSGGSAPKEDKEILAFLASLATIRELTHVDRAVAMLWRLHEAGSREDISSGMIASTIANAGYSRPNPTRLAAALRQDPRVSTNSGSFRLHVSALAKLRDAYAAHVGPQLPPPSDSVVPIELFIGVPFLERVVVQINGAYDTALYDCCAVMCRRLVETLIIQSYLKQGREDEIKDSGESFVPLGRLVNYAKGDPKLALTRNSKRALADVKTLGDWSAHSWRYNARKADIDAKASSIRLLSEELAHIAGLAAPNAGGGVP